MPGRSDADAVRLPRQHLPLADGRGRDARARARSGAGGVDRAGLGRHRRLARRQPAGRARHRRPRAPGASCSRAPRARCAREDFDDFDLILAMDRTNLADLRRLAPDERARARSEAAARVRPGERGSAIDDLDVPDPYYGGPRRLRGRARPGPGRVRGPARTDSGRPGPVSLPLGRERTHGASAAATSTRPGVSCSPTAARRS